MIELGQKVMGRAIERTADAELACGDAIGALEMVSQREERDLLTGYSGSAALKHLRTARTHIAKAKALLDALSGTARTEPVRE